MILQGDVREKLKELPEKSIQTCVTSPPYWGLRDYGQDGQLGLEPTPEEYVANMVEVFREVKRVLRDDGTLWLNLGDSYNGANMNQTGQHGYNDGRKNRSERYSVGGVQGLKPKDIVGIPWSVAFALRADGWYLRQDIIWHKPNPMPESVTDRCTKAHEYIFLLSKSSKYYYDAEAVKEPSVDKESYNGRRLRKMTDEYVKTTGHANTTAVPEGKTYPERNKRSVWTVTTQPYPGAHFATFPPKLIEPCILAGSSNKSCEVCGAPWERVTEKESVGRKRSNGMPIAPMAGKKGYDCGSAGSVNTTTTGWQPTCKCENNGMARSKVLDPFAGSGTTLMVAEENGREGIGIELNPEYVKLIEERLSQIQPKLF